MRRVLLAGLTFIALAGCEDSRRSEGVFLTNAVLLQQRLSISEADARSRVNRDALSQ